MLSKSEVYGGKICAALDRQHPRDLFDIYQLIQNDAITEDIIKGFVVMLLSANRPLYEIIAPNILDRESVFYSEFQGMTDTDFTYEQHIKTLKYLIKIVQRYLRENYKNQLLDFVSLNADFASFNIQNLEKFPAVKWKIQNLKKLREINPDKFKQEYHSLKKILD